VAALSCSTGQVSRLWSLKAAGGQVDLPHVGGVVLFELCGGEGKLFDTQIYSARCKV
jgi:hypothetical protein